MLVLAAANAVGVILFGALYAVAGANLMSQQAYLACLALIFGGVTVLWVRVERRHRDVPALSRVGRAAVALVAILVATPMFVLTPLFWIGPRLPAEVGVDRVAAALMALTLVALVLIVLVNMVGATIATAAGLRSSRRAG